MGRMRLRTGIGGLRSRVLRLWSSVELALVGDLCDPTTLRCRGSSRSGCRTGSGTESARKSTLPARCFPRQAPQSSSASGASSCPRDDPFASLLDRPGSAGRCSLQLPVQVRCSRPRPVSSPTSLGGCPGWPLSQLMYGRAPLALRIWTSAQDAKGMCVLGKETAMTPFGRRAGAWLRWKKCVVLGWMG